VPSGPACGAPGADCACLTQVSTACHPTGGILAAFAGRGGCAKFGKPLLPVRPRLATGGTYQEFEHGEIAAYPNWAGDPGASMPDFVLSGVDAGAKIEVEWGSTAPFDYDFFILRWDLDDHADNVKKQHDEHPQQQDVNTTGKSAKSDFPVTGNGTHVIYVEGCNKSVFMVFSSADCKQGWSHPVYVDHLLNMKDPIPQPAVAPIVIPAGILDVPDIVQLSADQQRPIIEDLCRGKLIDSEGDHKGEIATTAMLANVQSSAQGLPCNGKTAAQLRADVNQAILDAVVVTKPGTDVSEFMRIVSGAAVGAAAGAVVGMLLGAALTAMLGGLPSIVGGVVSLLGAIVGGTIGVVIKDPPGDYDMRLTGLLQIVHRFPSEIFPASREKLIDKLLTVRGGADERKDLLWIMGLPTPVMETENHVWMTESARFLTNNLLAADYIKKGLAVPKEYDNEQNGMTDWMLEGLRLFLIEDFYELNSRPYGPYILQAIQNLAEFGAWGATCTVIVPAGSAPSPRRCDVRRAARNVLDFLAAKFAVSSNELRRAAPYRRQPPFRDYPRLLTNGGDDLSWRYFPFTGGSRLIHDERHSRIMEVAGGDLMAAFQGDYHPPVIVTDLIRSTVTPTTTSLQRFHDTRRDSNIVEVYYRDPAFLISAGGKHDPGFGAAGFTSDEDAWSLPTTLMPTKQGNDYRDFVRIAGHTADLARVNTCVGPGFACGMNPTLPLGLPAACTKTSGNWTFIDFDANTAQCPFGFGFYVAFYREKCVAFDCIGAAGDSPTGSFGFFEATPYRTFDSYMADVLALNGTWNYEFDKINVYKRPLGGRVTFALNADEKHWPIVDYDIGAGVVAPERRYDKWPVAQGDVMNAPREGCIVVTNVHLQQQLILDHTDVNRPRRTILPVPPPRECSCPLPDSCIGPRAE
jgi:hypothetical protein